jgi:hypothetical protein
MILPRRYHCRDLGMARMRKMFLRTREEDWNRGRCRLAIHGGLLFRDLPS